MEELLGYLILYLNNLQLIFNPDQAVSALENIIKSYPLEKINDIIKSLENPNLDDYDNKELLGEQLRRLTELLKEHLEEQILLAMRNCRECKSRKP